MADLRVQRLAQLLVRYSAPVAEGNKVEISGTTLAAPLLREIYRETLRAGGLPLLRMALPDQGEILYKTAGDAQLTTVSPVDRMVIEEFDRRFVVLSDENTQELSGVDPARQALYQKARRSLQETFMRRSGEGSLDWNICLYPTPAYAQDAGMSLSDYEDFAYSACLLDRDDPVAAWQEVRQRQQRLVDYLKDKREVHLVSQDTDLRFSIAGRTFINDYGTKNMPGGEVFSGPVEDSVEGTIRYTYPAFYQGQVVEDVRLRFERGRVIAHSARTNERFLSEMLDLDEGARTLGECAFGTNNGIQRFTRNVLFDEKMGGTMHFALGAGYPDTGALNQSALHWDMVTSLRDGNEVRVDGKLFIKDGEFVI